MFAPANFRSDQYLYTIAEGDTIADVTTALVENGFVRSPLGMKIAFRLSGTNIVRAGTYNVSPRMNAWQIAAAIKAGETAGTRITIPEGFTVSQIYERLEASQVVSTRALGDWQQ